MLNIVDFTHGGCIAYLVDMSVSALLTLDSSDPTITSCTSIPAVALEVYHGREPKLATVSQSLVVHFLGPSKACVSLLVVILSEVNASACSGDQLRLVSTTVVVGGRVRTLYCEARRSNPLVYLAHTYRSYRCGPRIVTDSLRRRLMSSWSLPSRSFKFNSVDQYSCQYLLVISIFPLTLEPMVHRYVDDGRKPDGAPLSPSLKPRLDL
jgi:hypothetical protein